MSATQPSRMDYSDYRSFLADRQRALKAADSKFSHRFVNQRMEARSAGWFSDVLAGRQKLKPRHVAPLSALFRLDAQEKELLRVLVQIESADAPEEKSAAYEKWLEFQGHAQEDIDRDRFRYFEHWHFPVLREFLLLGKSKVDPASLGRMIDPPISVRQVQDALKTLSRLGLLNPDSPAPSPILVKKPGRTPHWRKTLSAIMEHALPALEKFPKEERDFSALTLSLSPEGLRAAGEEIALLRRRLLAISERDSKRNRVYQCLFQVFPVTRPLERSDA